MALHISDIRPLYLFYAGCKVSNKGTPCVKRQFRAMFPFSLRHISKSIRAMFIKFSETADRVNVSVYLKFHTSMSFLGPTQAFELGFQVRNTSI